MKTHTIHAQPDHANPRRRYRQAVNVLLEDDVDDDFIVEEDDIPDNIDRTWQATPQSTPKTIRWVSSFKLTKKPGKAVTGKTRKYSIELDKGGNTLVYYDGSVKTLGYTEISATRVRAELSVIDPPIGWVD